MSAGAASAGAGVGAAAGAGAGVCGCIAAFGASAGCLGRARSVEMHREDLVLGVWGRRGRGGKDGGRARGEREEGRH